MIDDINPVLLDFESRSRADLKTLGGRRYWEHYSTEALVVCWHDTADDSRGAWFPGEAWPHHGRTLAAHNWSGFDRFGAVRYDFVGADETHHIDTSELARRAGLPGSLDALGTRWLGLEKDKDASRFTTALSQVRRPAGKKNPDAISAEDWRQMSDEDRRLLGVQTEITPEVMARVVPYCELDVRIMAEGWPRLSYWHGLEDDVERVDRIINDRGIGLDTELCEALLLNDEINAEATVSRAAAELGWTFEEARAAARSPLQFCAETGLADARKTTVAGVDHPLVRARQALASIAAGKLRAGLARVSDDGRLRDAHRYYGGHTGRWAGRGMQLQNLPRPDKAFEEWTDAQICKLADRVRGGLHIATPAEINLLLRATLRARDGYTFAVCDFSGVEARALAWCAGDEEALDVFTSGKDPYKVAAAEIFGVSYEQVDKPMRHVGKIAELACGYGQGGAKFAETAASMGADLEAAGVDSFEVVDRWRRLHAPTVRFWSDVENAFRAAIGGREVTLAGCTFQPSSDGEDVAIWLPSGRPIVYPDARITTARAGRRGTSIVFSGGHTGEEFTYGGKLVENLIQALCRDMLAHSLVGAEAASLNPVMHVHDEIVAEVPEQSGEEGLQELRRIMTTLPEWAEGFPVGAAGFHGRVYRK